MLDAVLRYRMVLLDVQRRVGTDTGAVQRVVENRIEKENTVLNAAARIAPLESVLHALRHYGEREKRVRCVEAWGTTQGIVQRLAE